MKSDKARCESDSKIRDATSLSVVEDNPSENWGVSYTSLVYLALSFPGYYLIT